MLRDALNLDTAATAEMIERAIRTQVREFHRRGAVVGVSGGIDSAVVLALCARALGGERVLALLMPERDSSLESLELGRSVAARFGAPCVVEDLTETLSAAGCYQRQAEAIRMIVPEFSEGWRSKITMPSLLAGARLNMAELTVQSPAGDVRTSRMTAAAYLQLVAATNFKQRLRKTMEYYHADRLNFVVAGTPNRLEYDQGFFVKQGDGSADIKPIAHLYKTQVYSLAEYLDVPAEIRKRQPTTDTFSLPQTQEEFYFSVPFQTMDVCLYAHNHGITAEETAAATGLTREQVERVFLDIEQKRRTTRYLHAKPVLVEPVREVAVSCAE